MEGVCENGWSTLLVIYYYSSAFICQGQLWVVILCAYVLLVSYPHRYMLLAWLLQYYFLTILASPTETK